MSDNKVVITVPAVEIYELPNEVPAVVEANRDAALVLLQGARQALNLAGFTMEHHEGPYGEVSRAMKETVRCGYPELDVERVMDAWLDTCDILAAVELVRGNEDR